MLLIEYSVEMVEGATVENLMQILQVDRERLFKINGWEDEDDVDLSKRLHIPIGERFRAIQALHLQTTAHHGDLDPSDLLAWLQGETELAGSARAPGLQTRTRQAQRARQPSS